MDTAPSSERIWNLAGVYYSVSGRSSYKVKRFWVEHVRLSNTHNIIVMATVSIGMDPLPGQLTCAIEALSG